MGQKDLKITDPNPAGSLSFSDVVVGTRQNYKMPPTPLPTLAWGMGRGWAEATVILSLCLDVGSGAPIRCWAGPSFWSGNRPAMVTSQGEDGRGTGWGPPVIDSFTNAAPTPGTGDTALSQKQPRLPGTARSVGTDPSPTPSAGAQRCHFPEEVTMSRTLKEKATTRPEAQWGECGPGEQPDMGQQVWGQKGLGCWARHLPLSQHHQKVRLLPFPSQTPNRSRKPRACNISHLVSGPGTQSQATRTVRARHHLEGSQWALPDS